MKPRVRMIPANSLEYPFNAALFVPDDRGPFKRGEISVRWYHTVRATSLDALCNGITEVLPYAQMAASA